MDKKIVKKKQDMKKKKKRVRVPVCRFAIPCKGFQQVFLSVPDNLYMKLVERARVEGDKFIDTTIRHLLSKQLGIKHGGLEEVSFTVPEGIKNDANELGLSIEEYINMTLRYLSEQKRDLIKQIKNFVEHGEYKLSGGQTSRYYVNVKEACSNPRILEHIVKEMKTIIKDKKVDRIGCVELGAVPIAVALSQATGIDYSIIRKKTKSHGVGGKIIGKIKKGQHVLLVEDVTTSGKSVVNAVKIIRKNGGVVQHVISFVDRNKGAVKLLKKHGVYLASLLKNYDLLEGEKNE